jgi:hypothetical protein
MRTIRLLSTTLLAVTGLIAVGATTQSANAAGSKSLSIAHTLVVKGEQTSVFGTVTSGDARTVKLQYRNQDSGSWTTKTTTTSQGDGDFELPISTSRTRYWRYYAPSGAGHSAIYGNSLKVKVVEQKVQLFVVSFDNPCINLTNDVTVVADFYPARQGRNVAFATNKGLKSDEQDENGVAVIHYDASGGVANFDMKAAAVEYHGIPVKTTVAKPYNLVFCVD